MNDTLDKTKLDAEYAHLWQKVKGLDLKSQESLEADDRIREIEQLREYSSGELHLLRQKNA